MLLQVQRNGDMGSPRVAGSINRSKASSKPGSDWVSVRRPPPGDRTRAAATSRLFAESSSSFSPAMIVGRDKPVARATSEIPPQPTSRASAAAHCLRLRSSNSTATKRNLRRIRASTFASCMRKSSHLPPQSPIPICQSYFFALPQWSRKQTGKSGSGSDSEVVTAAVASTATLSSRHEPL